MFQSTRPHGARHYTTTHAERINCFNPRARTGRDRALWVCQDQAHSFNPRARTGRDGGEQHDPVSYTHLTLPTTPYV